MSNEPTAGLKVNDFHVISDYDGNVRTCCPVCVGGSPGEQDPEGRVPTPTFGEVLTAAAAHIRKWHP